MACKNAEIDYSVFARTVSGHKRHYIRFWMNGKVFLTKATDEKTAAKAGAVAAHILETEDLLAIAQQKIEKKEHTLSEIDRLASMKVLDFLLIFWDPSQSPYLQDLQDADRKLSGSYIRDNRRNAKNYWGTPLFTTISMQELRLKHIDSRIRELRKEGKSRFTISAILDSIRKPCSWLTERNVLEKINFSAIVLPKAPEHERGILTHVELKKITELEAHEPWIDKNKKIHVSIQPRSRLKGKLHHEDETPIGWREKLIVALIGYTGMRAGEARALQWQFVDFENKLIHIYLNYTDDDGIKDPKAKSKRTVAIPESLEIILTNAFEIATLLGQNEPKSHVILNATDFSRPVSIKTIENAWKRVLSAIDIKEEERKARNLVVHGLRHMYATRHIDAGMAPAAAAKLTGHKVLSTLDRYSGHTQPETLEKSRKILNNDD